MQNKTFCVFGKKKKRRNFYLHSVLLTPYFGFNHLETNERRYKNRSNLQKLIFFTNFEKKEKIRKFFLQKKSGFKKYNCTKKIITNKFKKNCI